MSQPLTELFNQNSVIEDETVLTNGLTGFEMTESDFWPWMIHVSCLHKYFHPIRIIQLPRSRNHFRVEKVEKLYIQNIFKPWISWKKAISNRFQIFRQEIILYSKLITLSSSNKMNGP